MKQKKLFYLVAVSLVFTVIFAACSQSTNKVSVADDTEMVVEKGDETAKCGGDGEGKCGDGKEVSDSSKKCGEGKCGEGKDGEKKCGEGKCGEGKDGEKKKCGEGKCGEGK